MSFNGLPKENLALLTQAENGIHWFYRNYTVSKIIKQRVPENELYFVCLGISPEATRGYQRLESNLARGNTTLKVNIQKESRENKEKKS